jgi:plastocyanin
MKGAAMNRFKIAMYLIFFAIFLLPLTSATGEEEKIYDVNIIQHAFKLNPAELTIGLGETVKWTNTDDQKHFLASIPGSGPTDELEIFALMEPGHTYSHTFKAAGEYPYFCFIHNKMTGKITVTSN